MKKLLKIGALSLAILASLFLLSNTTKAANANVNLKITGVAGTCVYGSTSNIGTTTFSYSAQAISGAFTGTAAPGGSTRWCHDSSGAASWNLAMVMQSDLVNTSNGAYTLSSGAIAYSNYAVHQQVGSGTCTSVTGASTGISDWKSLNGSQKVLEKTSAIGEVCRVQTTGLYLKATIPAGQNIGTYSGQIVITLPSNGF